MTVVDEVDNLLDIAHSIAMREVERLAKEAITASTWGARRFVCGMGTVFFVNDENEDLDIEKFPEIHELFRMFDTDLHLSGTSIRINAACEVEYEW